MDRYIKTMNIKRAQLRKYFGSDRHAENTAKAVAQLYGNPTFVGGA